jgi:CBS domain-containing protein
MAIDEFYETAVITITKEASIQEAATLMRENNIGNIIVVDEEGNSPTPIGILTDRDIVIKVIAERADVNNVTVGEVMAENIQVFLKEEGVKEILNEMKEKEIRRAPIVDKNGKLVGIVTVDDLLILISHELNDLVEVIRRQGAGQKIS